MPVFIVETLATVRRVYEVEAADEKEAEETSTLNEADDETDVFEETTSIMVKESVGAHLIAAAHAQRGEGRA